MFAGFAAVNAIGVFHIFQLAARLSTSHAQLNARINILGRTVTGISGAMILLLFGWVGMQDPDGAWQNPYSPGNTATALSWLGIAFFGEQDTVSKRWQHRKRASESEPCATAAGSEVHVQSERESERESVTKAQMRPKSACVAAGDNV